MLNVTGRKVRAALDPGQRARHRRAAVLAGSQWTVNFRGGAPAQVVREGRTTTMRGELITDGAQVAECSIAARPATDRAKPSVRWA